MLIRDKSVDNGRAFDWGRTSSDYAKYRDIYPRKFYKKIINRGLCIGGQSVLDLGTGTGVLPRNLYSYGAKWTATDISDHQIGQARRLSQGMNIEYHALATEDICFASDSFDVITACQCFWYFDHERVAPNLFRMLRPGGRLMILYMAWLPAEDDIARASEQLVLRYNPYWSGGGETMHPIDVPAIYGQNFELVWHEEFRLDLPFTRESWHGRMKACRGVGASLSEGEIARWEVEHQELLKQIAPPTFTVRHYAAMTELKAKK